MRHDSRQRIIGGPADQGVEEEVNQITLGILFPIILIPLDQDEVLCWNARDPKLIATVTKDRIRIGSRDEEPLHQPVLQ